VKDVSAEKSTAERRYLLPQQHCTTTDVDERRDMAGQTASGCLLQGTRELPRRDSTAHRQHCRGSEADLNCQWLDIHCCQADQSARSSVQIPENSHP